MARFQEILAVRDVAGKTYYAMLPEGRATVDDLVMLSNGITGKVVRKAVDYDSKMRGMIAELATVYEVDRVWYKGWERGEENA